MMIKRQVLLLLVLRHGGEIMKKAIIFLMILVIFPGVVFGAAASTKTTKTTKTTSPLAQQPAENISKTTGEFVYDKQGRIVSYVETITDDSKKQITVYTYFAINPPILEILQDAALCPQPFDFSFTPLPDDLDFFEEEDPDCILIENVSEAEDFIDACNTTANECMDQMDDALDLLEEQRQDIIDKLNAMYDPSCVGSFLAGLSMLQISDASDVSRHDDLPSNSIWTTNLQRIKEKAGATCTGLNEINQNLIETCHKARALIQSIGCLSEIDRDWHIRSIESVDTDTTCIENGVTLPFNAVDLITGHWETCFNPTYVETACTTPTDEDDDWSLGGWPR